MKKIVILRKISQAFSLIIFFVIILFTAYPLLPFWPSAHIFKISPLLMIIVSISQRMIIPGLVFSCILLALTFIFGRFFCGWVCPLGGIMDIVGSFRIKHRKGTPFFHKKLIFLKFFVLLVILFFSFAGAQIAWVFDPIVIFARFISFNLLPFIFLMAQNFLVFLVRITGFYSPLLDLYHNFKASVFSGSTYFLSHALSIFFVFLLVCLSVLITKRFWCRYLCPLGALFSLVLTMRQKRDVVRGCQYRDSCANKCRMGTLRCGLGNIDRECILCGDCIYDCLNKNIIKKNENLGSKGPSLKISRRNFIFMAFSTISAFRFIAAKEANESSNIIRPPGALREDYFNAQCVRCGNCMKVCVTGGLQPLLFENGVENLWTPRLIPEIGYCEYTCALCGQVCPTGAIKKMKIDEKKKVKIGLAKINQQLCLPYAKNKQCIVCQEHCPVPGKAIKLMGKTVYDSGVHKPFVDIDLCIGCGICENKCPVSPVKAIKIFPKIV